jgi:hypothetical protein
MATDRSASSIVTLNPSSGPAGTTTITMSASATGTGLTDFYIGNENGDIVLERAYVEPLLITLSTNSVEVQTSHGTMITVTD